LAAGGRGIPLPKSKELAIAAARFEISSMKSHDQCRSHTSDTWIEVYTLMDEYHRVDVEMSVAYTDGDNDCPSEGDRNTLLKERPMYF